MTGKSFIRWVKPICKFTKFTTEIYNKLHEPKINDKVFNNPIYGFK